VTLTKPVLHTGGIYTDQRGILKYINEEDPGCYRRFYLITHPDTNVVRAWQGHKKEEKGFYAISGSFIIAVTQPKNFETPGDNEIPKFYHLSIENNHFLRVPGGCYTGIKAFTPGSTLLVLSEFDLEGSKADDYRQPPDKWVDWKTIFPE
jgi:dTDP-4-dehydrorhamnose 3,5-epimerase-like enzyme